MTDGMDKEAENISQAVVPYFPDDSKKSRYLSFRIANFSVREACQLAKCHFTSVKRWRATDTRFAHIDTDGLTELRQQLSKEYINIEFTRNFQLVLQKDFEVLIKSLRGEVLSDKEHQYLLKLRNHYTPQQLVLIKQLVGEVGSGEEPFDYTKLTMIIRREKEEIHVTRE